MREVDERAGAAEVERLTGAGGEGQRHGAEKPQPPTLGRLLPARPRAAPPPPEASRSQGTLDRYREACPAEHAEPGERRNGVLAEGLAASLGGFARSGKRCRSLA